MQTLRTICATLLVAPWATDLAAQAKTPPPKAGQPAAATKAMRLVPAGKPTTDVDELLARRKEKLAKPVFQKASWLMDYDAARKQAAAEGKWILTYFTRSYAP